MKVKKLQVNSEDQISRAVSLLQQGEVIAYPTEAVYGLGCDPENIDAIKKILSLKQREKEKGLILVAASFSQLNPYIQSLDKEIESKLIDSWKNAEKAITWLVPAQDSTSAYLKGKHHTLAVRVSKHPTVKKLCQQFNGAIVSTSANLAGQAAARTAQQAKKIFGDEITVVDGETNKNASPSEIRDALTNEVMRSAT